MPSTSTLAGLLALGGITYFGQKYEILDNLKMLRNAYSANLITIARKRENMTVADVWDLTMQSIDWNKIGLINAESGATYTFGEIEKFSNQVANWAIQTAKLKPRDVCALFMENRPEYIMIWLGLTKAGVVVALINSNNKKKTLLHALKTGQCTSMIYGAELENVVADIANDVNMPLYVSGGDNGRNVAIESLDDVLFDASSARVSPSVRAGITSSDSFGFIYTSGTTGLPKACVIQHLKFMMAGRGMAIFLGITPDDILYTCLPLYHSAGGMLGAGIFLMGCTTVVSRKFSASNYCKLLYLVFSIFKIFAFLTLLIQFRDIYYTSWQSNIAISTMQLVRSILVNWRGIC
jgi:solute carrier family 27 (fatty acid transporter), member 1/4